jgi:hypothetical protein
MSGVEGFDRISLVQNRGKKITGDHEITGDKQCAHERNR